MTNNTPQKILADYKAANKQAQKFIGETKKKIAELDWEYFKILAKHDVAVMKAAKKILEEKNGIQ